MVSFSDGQILSEHPYDQVELLEVLLSIESVLFAFGLAELVVECKALHHVFVLIVECAREENSEVGLTNSSHLKVIICMFQLSELALVIHFVHEHQENLQDQTLVLVASRHLDHEQEDAEVVEVEPLHHLLLREVSFGNPLIDFS